MSDPTPRRYPVVRGITLLASGHVNVEPGMGRVLFDLAIQLENSVPYPVDVEHVLAAIVLAARQGELGPDHQIVAEDDALIAILMKHLRVVFERYDGRVSEDD